MKHFYKYRPVDKFTISTIVNSEIYMSSPKSFNDPFDCWCRLMPEGTDEDHIELLKKYKSINPENEYNLYRNMSDEVKNNLWNDVLIDSLDHVGIYSLTEKNDSIIMFAHYGDNQKGICLQFDNSGNEFAKAKKIDYSAEKLHIINPLNPNEEYEKIITTKYIHWKYEHEWRLLHSYDELPRSRIVEFDQNLLSGIILGCRIPESDEKLIRHLIKNRNIELFRAEPHDEHYKLIIKNA